MIIPSQRHPFDLPEDMCYLNTAYMSPQTKAMREAGKAGVDFRAEPYGVAEKDFFENPDAARSNVAKIINARAQDIAIVPSVSYGIATAARNLRARKGQIIVVIESTFPSLLFSWRRVADEQGLEIVTIPTPEDGNWTAALLAVIEKHGDQIAVAALPNCHWSTGQMIDLVSVGKELKAVGSWLVLDITQSIGALPIDMQAVDPDFVAIGGYKWLFCPYGVSFLYAAPRHQDGIPLEEGWIAREGSENFASLAQYQSLYAAGAIRYDMGERALFAAMPQAVEATRQILEWGVANIQETLKGVNAKIEAIFGAYGFSLPHKETVSGHLIGLSAARALPEDFLARMKQQKIYLSQRGASVRIAPHLYIDDQALDVLAKGLRAVLK